MDENSLKNLKKQIGLKIKQLRTEKNWSRKQMTDKLNISVPAYGSIERGETDVSITRLAQLADIFEMTLPDLLGITGKTISNVTKVRTQTCFGINPVLNNMDNLNFRQELEKYQQAQQKEIENLQRRITQLEEKINQLLKNERR